MAAGSFFISVLGPPGRLADDATNGSLGTWHTGTSSTTTDWFELRIMTNDGTNSLIGRAGPVDSRAVLEFLENCKRIILQRGVLGIVGNVTANEITWK